MLYEVIRPSDGECVSRHDEPFGAQGSALDYALVDEESIVVVRVTHEARIIIAVAHPSGALFSTVSTGGRM